MSFVFPGQRIVPSSKIPSTKSDIKIAEAGLYHHAEDSFIHASLFGKLSVISNGTTGSTTFEIVTPFQNGKSDTISPIISTPRVGDVVIGKVTKISQRNVSVSILALTIDLSYFRCSTGHSGIIRLQDIYDIILGENIQHIVISAFRPGDIVRVRVLAIAEGNVYYLSSASADLGVIYARNSTTGTLMTPVSTQEMICPTTSQIEPRKVAVVEEIKAK